MSIQCTNVADRRTHRQTDRDTGQQQRPRLRIASAVKKSTTVNTVNMTWHLLPKFELSLPHVIQLLFPPDDDDETHLTAMSQDNSGKWVPECLHSGFIGAKRDVGARCNWTYKLHVLTREIYTACTVDATKDVTSRHVERFLYTLPILLANQSCTEWYNRITHSYSSSLSSLSYSRFNAPIHNVVEDGVLQAMWEELAGKVGHCDQLITC